MPGRNFNSGTYRYSFNGKENDQEVKGNGNQIDFGARAYDPRLGRFLSIDKYQSLKAHLTPYDFAANSPIVFIDRDGNYRMSPELQEQYPQLTNILKNLHQLATENPQVWQAFKENLGITEEEALELVTWNSGPDVLVEDIFDIGTGKLTFAITDETTTTFNKKLIENIEGRRNVISDIDAAILIFITALHEPQHYVELNAGYKYNVLRNKLHGEVGKKFEKVAFGKIYGTGNIGKFKIKQPRITDALIKVVKQQSTSNPQTTPKSDGIYTDKNDKYHRDSPTDYNESQKEENK